LIKSRDEAIAHFQRDIARWEKELQVLANAGQAYGEPVRTIRTWISELRRTIEGLGGGNATPVEKSARRRNRSRRHSGEDGDGGHWGR